jgi:hypothetical protein
MAAAERRDAEKAQARTIVIDQVHIDLMLNDNGESWAGRLITRVHNFSAEPVLEVTVHVDNRTGKLPNLPFDLAEVAVLAPGACLEVDRHVGEVVSLKRSFHEALKEARVSVRFTDAAGRNWIRDDEGQPEQVFDWPPMNAPLPRREVSSVHGGSEAQAT